MEETERVAKRLEKMLKNGKIEEETALKYLRRLRGVDMTLDILTKTGVGIIINKIRKESDNPEVATLGKNIIKQWKKLVPG
ncbi:Transcription elongation factor S-II [Paragonimus heterotremus]|uniref:Transcription elongation factor S-II n=1 Tax=Paragonimus heterotremus TaxID=100268 RepID=A0A8J4SXR7_9TREM|nr:Transcription elongation factor S-II [Paragonimus heterotremus]